MVPFSNFATDVKEVLFEAIYEILFLASKNKNILPHIYIHCVFTNKIHSHETKESYRTTYEILFAYNLGERIFL